MTSVLIAAILVAQVNAAQDPAPAPATPSAPAAPTAPSPSSAPATPSATPYETAPATVPAPAADEQPADIRARVHYERAVRAELDSDWDQAIKEAQATVAAAPSGRFANDARNLEARARSFASAGQKPANGKGPRVELVISSTLTGLYLGALAAAAGNTDEKAAIVLLMLGTGAGLVGSVAGSNGRQVPRSMPAMLELGAFYGTSSALLLHYLTDSSGNASAQALAASSVGVLAGLLASPYLTAGDAGAALSLGVYGAFLPMMVEGSLAHPDGKTLAWTALLGSTAGVIGGPILNRTLNFSRGRWSLIMLGGGVGALFGAGIGVLADAHKSNDARPLVALTTLGTLAGVVATDIATSGLDADDPHGTALLHLENGKPSAGNVLSAVGPGSIDGRLALSVRVLDGAF